MAAWRYKEIPIIASAIIFLLVPFCTFLYISNRPDNYQNDVSLQDELDLLNKRLQEVEAANRNRMVDVLALRQDVRRALRSEPRRHVRPNAYARANSSSIYVGRETLWQKQTPEPNADPRTNDIKLPSLKDYLPHLKYFDGLQPAVKLSSGRSDVNIVLGVPTVKRPVPGYLLSTLQNLIDNMDEEEKEDTMLVVCIAEKDRDYINGEISAIKEKFQSHLDAGLLEVIVPPESYYPDLDKLRLTLGDPLERVRWRTKQNLDFAYLMMYAQSKGTFYVQLEDDILSKAHYITKMKNFALKQLREKKDWIVLDFCQLGFIGKMFRTVDLSKLITFFAIFHGDKPVDWLLDHMVQTKVCRFDRDRKDCKKQKDSVWIHYRPSLFQHVGTHSSLRGKVQKLKDKQFGKSNVYYPHRNPPALLKTSLKVYRSYGLQRAYKGESYFWARSAMRKDNITMHFSPPVLLERYYFRSGNADHPDDILYNASVQIFTATSPKIPELIPYPRTDDNFFVLGNFCDNAGIAEGSVVPTVGPVSVLRIHVDEDSDNWILLSEIAIETAPVESAIATAFNLTSTNRSSTNATS